MGQPRPPAFPSPGGGIITPSARLSAASTALLSTMQVWDAAINAALFSIAAMAQSLRALDV